jgi:hypothetical protein
VSATYPKSRQSLQLESALDHATSSHVRINILTWLFRLRQRESDHRGALKIFFTAMELLGYGTDIQDSRGFPSREEEILSLIDAPPPPRNAEGLTAMSLADLMAYLGFAVYSLLAIEERFKIFNFVIPIILHNHAATKHPSTAYTWYLFAILLGGENISRLGLVKAWLKVADSTYRLSGGPMDAAVETCRAIASYYSAPCLEEVDFSQAHHLWSATSSSNPDIKLRVLGLDLATQALSGRAIGDMLKQGKETSAALLNCTQPSSGPSQNPFLLVCLSFVSSARRQREGLKLSTFP